MCFEDLLILKKSFDMEVLFYLLSEGSGLRLLEMKTTYEKGEWSESVKCLGKAHLNWLSHCIQVMHLRTKTVQIFFSRGCQMGGLGSGSKGVGSEMSSM